LTLNASGKFGLVQLPAVKTLTAFTAVAVGRRKANPNGQLQAFLAKAGAHTAFSACHSSSTTPPGPITQYAGANTIYVDSGLWTYKNDDWHTITTRYSTPNYTVWMEDMVFATGSAAGHTATVADMFVGITSSVSVFAKYDLNAIALFDRALTDAEVVNVANTLKIRAAKNSILIGNSRFLVAEGDSITFGSGSAGGGYANLFGVNSNPTVNGRVYAVANSTLNGYLPVSGRLSLARGMVPAQKNGRLYIYSLLIGRNELVGYPGGVAAYAAAVTAYLATVKASGFDRVVLATLLPSTLTGFNVARNALNAIYTAPGWAAANGIDAICDFAADATMGADAAASDAALYPDGTHPSTAGQTNLEAIYRATINGVV
jgi:hypothetical protein